MAAETAAYPVSESKPAAGKSALELEMEALLMSTTSLMKDVKVTKNEFQSTRRKSKDLEETLGSMAEASDAWQGLATGGRRSRRGSRDYTEAALQEAFDKMDKDKSGQIDQDELKAAIRTMDPNVSDQTVKEMMNWADADSDGLCSFDEFKKIMLISRHGRRRTTEAQWRGVRQTNNTTRANSPVFEHAPCNSPCGHRRRSDNTP